MLLEVDTFCQRALGNIEPLINELQESTGRLGDEEARAWRRSLPIAAQALGHDALKPLHIHVGPGISVEYRLPASSSWADLVLLGRGQTTPAVVVLELKDWETSHDAPGPRPGLILHKGIPTLHPSEQVRGYVEYCRRFHSAVQAQSASVAGCVFVTASATAAAYYSPPHDELVAEYPVFTTSRKDSHTRLPSYLAGILREPDAAFAQAFDAGVYEQDRSFVLQVAEAISSSKSSPFVLLDRQREGFEHCVHQVDKTLDQSGSREKKVIVVEGPPGSGKSVLAAQLWAHLARQRGASGNVVLATTSSSQRSNWEHLFGEVARSPAGGGLVMPANRYQPGLTLPWVKGQKDAGQPLEIEDWQENLERFARSGLPVRCEDDSFAISIVDEAHALIDPAAPDARGVSPSGYVMHAGPQAWHIIRASQISIFLLDGDQSYRDNETTTRERIVELAGQQGIHDVQVISLEGAQFRCAGSSDYMAWLDHLLELGGDPRSASVWRKGSGGPFLLEVLRDPAALDEALRTHLALIRH